MSVTIIKLSFNVNILHSEQIDTINNRYIFKKSNKYI